MGHGLNVSAKSVKGGRSYIRLNSLTGRKLIECLNPEEKRHRLYRRTKKGEGLVKDIK